MNLATQIALGVGAVVLAPFVLSFVLIRCATGILGAFAACFCFSIFPGLSPLPIFLFDPDLAWGLYMAYASMGFVGGFLSGGDL